LIEQSTEIVNAR